MKNQIDFTPLSNYSKLFRLFRVLRRVRMVITRIMIAAFFALVAYVIFYLVRLFTTWDAASSSDYSFSYSSDDGPTIDLGLLIFLIVAGYATTFILGWSQMDAAWKRFAEINGFKRTNFNNPLPENGVLDYERAFQDNLDQLKVMEIPSFKGKALSTSLGPVHGNYEGVDFAFFTRQYKEGGIIRWRERQMDTVFTLIVPADLPHIVIDARANERARRSNMTTNYPKEQSFQFEGAYGDKYDVFTSPESRVVALQLFTPDVLEILYVSLPTADIEIRGRNIWIVQRYGVMDDVLARTMFEAGKKLYSELEKQIRVAGLMRSVGPATQPQPESSPTV